MLMNFDKNSHLARFVSLRHAPFGLVPWWLLFISFLQNSSSFSNYVSNLQRLWSKAL